MGDAGTLRGQFQRAIASENVVGAIATAQQMGRLGLEDALALCVLLARKDPPRFERAAVRWLGRFALELRGITLAEIRLALAALECLGGPAAANAAETLRRMCRDRR